ncbi:hypothetical protein [Streptomyces sp. NPDC008125]|uniref:hypothetical protein n=1 Tax=Streptomyces sp. NPDC008125 TaxID=3364811 RepID=UPI0036EF6886
MSAGLFISTMRTVVPLAAGWLLTLAASAGFDIDSTTVTSAVALVAALVYYLLFRVLEIAGQRAQGTVLQTIAGLALGWARPPSYPDLEPALDPVDPAGLASGSRALS